MSRIGKIFLAITGLAFVLSLSACGTVVKTGTDFQAVHYSDGPYSKLEFKDCLPPSERRRDGYADVNYYYPAGERTFEFDGSDAEPIAIQTKDGQQVTVKGVITFNFTENCDALRKFHEDKGVTKSTILPTLATPMKVEQPSINRKVGESFFALTLLFQPAQLLIPNR